MSSNIRLKRLDLKLTSQEKERFEHLFNSLQEQCNISPKRQSEIIIEGFFQYAEQLLSSYVPHTHTKSQSFTKQRKEAIYSLIEKIKEQGFMYYQKAYADLIASNECYLDLKIRTKINYFQTLLQAEDIYFLNIPYYYTAKFEQSKPIILIHKNSKWFPQLKELCFKINSQIYKLTHDQISEQKARDELFNRLQRRAKFKSNLDRAERVMLNAFLYEVKILEDKPMYDQTDLILQEVIQLRSQLRFAEALELLQQERKQKQAIEIKPNDDGIKFLEGLEQ